MICTMLHACRCWKVDGMALLRQSLRSHRLHTWHCRRGEVLWSDSQLPRVLRCCWRKVEPRRAVKQSSGLALHQRVILVLHSDREPKHEGRISNSIWHVWAVVSAILSLGHGTTLPEESSKNIRHMAVEEIIKPLAILRLYVRLETGPLFHMLC